MSAESLYSEAYSLHYKSGNLHQAFALYTQLVAEYAGTQEASYALTQIANLKSDPKFKHSMEAESAAQVAIAAKRARESEVAQLIADQGLSVKGLLCLNVGKPVAINAVDASKIEGAILVDTQLDHFTVKQEGLLVSIPYAQIVKIISSSNGNVRLGAFQGEYSLVIKVFDFVVYKGAVGLGVSVPV
jgi:hypothetical protein